MESKQFLEEFQAGIWKRTVSNHSPYVSEIKEILVKIGFEL
jgi:hypothetical protein